MANEFHLEATITGGRSAVNAIHRWTRDFQKCLTEDEKRRCNDFDSTANKNWMGFIPAVIDAFGYGSTHLGVRAFCDGGSLSSIKDEVTVWFLVKNHDWGNLCEAMEDEWEIYLESVIWQK